MAQNKFTFIGKVSLGKESEKFKPYKENKTDNGWISRRLVFNVSANDNVESCEVFGGYSEKNPIIYGFTKNNGNEKGKSIKIPFKDRNKKDIIENQAIWKLNIIKLSKDDNRRYLSKYDMAKDLYEIIQDEQYKDRLFKVAGDIEYQEYNGKIYTKFLVKRVDLIEDESEVEEGLNGNLELHFNREVIAVDNFKEDNKLILTGFTTQYDNELQEDVGVKLEGLVLDLSLVKENIREKSYKIWQGKVLKAGDTFNKLGLKVRFLNGTNQAQFTEDMLDEEQKELIEMGLMTFEDIKAEMGVGFGERVKEVVILGLAKGYSKGAEPTENTIEYYLPKTNVFDDEDENADVEEENEDDDDFNLDLLDLEDDDKINADADDDDLPF